MKPENILDAIGNVDDTCIKNAKEKNKSRKSFLVSVGAIAACFALVMVIPFISKTTQGTGPNELQEPIVDPLDERNSGPQNPDIQNPDVNIQYAFSYIRVYYNFDNKLKLAPMQNTLENTEMDNVLEYMETIMDSREGISYNNDEWNHVIQEKDFVIDCIDWENKLQAEYLVTNNSLFDYQTNTEYTLSDEEVKQLKSFCVK